MKRAVLILIAVALGATSVPAAAQPGAYAEAGQAAFADWVVMHSRTHGTLYFVAGLHSASPRGVGTLGIVGSGECTVKRGKHWTVTMCEGSGRAKRLDIGEFSFDPAMRSASLTMKARGVKNTASWRGRGKTPFAGASFFAGEGMAGADAVAARMAGVKAKILGRSMPRRNWMGFAFLVEGAGAFVYDGTRSRRSFDVGPDGTYTYSVTVKTPR